MRGYVGLDVHSKMTSFVIQRASGEEEARGEVPTTPAGFLSLKKRYGLDEKTPVALESGAVAFFTARALRELGLSPVVVDAREVRVKAQRPCQKSDSRDAVELCEGIRRGIYRSIVHMPSPEIELLRQTLSRRRHFVRLQTAQTNAAKRILRGAGLSEIARKRFRCDAGWERVLKALSDREDLRCFVAMHFEMWKAAREQQKALELNLRGLEKEHFQSAAERLRTVPGVGEIVALTAMAVLSDVNRFPSSKHAASYAGLVPKTWQSAESNRHGGITKCGSPELRAMLCEAAHQARRPDHPLNPYFRALLLRTGMRRAIVAVAHRLCRILYALLRDGATFDVSKLAVEKGEFRTVTTRTYRLKPALAPPACKAAKRRNS